MNGRGQFEPLMEPWGGSTEVGVIMPILNEERHLEEAVAAVLGQDYPGKIEFGLALGPSYDRTDEIAARITVREPRVRIVQNITGGTPDALNAALAASRSEIVVRVDGHGLLDRGYVQTAIELLQETGAANVGGLMDAEGATPFERAVAAAMTSPLGVGSARFHTGGEAGASDTVNLGVFRREWPDRIGGYDRRFVRAQGWELNHRIRQAGGVVWFSPRLRVAYRPRPKPDSVGQAVSRLWPLAARGLAYAPWDDQRAIPRPSRGRRRGGDRCGARLLVARCVGGATWLLAAMTVGGLAPPGDLTPRERVMLPVILPAMHRSWGWGFLSSRVRIENDAGLASRSTPH